MQLVIFAPFPIMLSRNSGPDEDQPKSCFGSSIPNPMSFPLPTEVGQVFLSGLEVAKGQGALGAPQQSMTIDPWTLGSLYSDISHTQGGGSTLPKRPLTRSVWITW